MNYIFFYFLVGALVGLAIEALDSNIIPNSWIGTLSVFVFWPIYLAIAMLIAIVAAAWDVLVLTGNMVEHLINRFWHIEY